MNIWKLFKPLEVTANKPTVNIGDVWEIDGDDFGNPFIGDVYKVTIKDIKGEWVEYTRSNNNSDSMRVARFVGVYKPVKTR